MRKGLPVRCLLLGGSLVICCCGAASRPVSAEDAAADGGTTGQPEAGVDSGVDAGPAFDCAAACSADPALCTGLMPDGVEPSTPCEAACGYMLGASGCKLGEDLRLLECLARTPGACEAPDGNLGCEREWFCFQICSDPSAALWCRPPDE